MCLLESRFCNKEAQAFEIVIDRLNFPLGIEPLTVMTIIQSFVNQTENSDGFVGKFFYDEGRLWGDQLEKIPKSSPGDEPDTIQHFLHVFATFQILDNSKAELYKLANDFPRMPSPAKKLDDFGGPPQRSLVILFWALIVYFAFTLVYFQIPNRRSSSDSTMANKIREKVKSEVDQSEPTENEPEEFDERVPEPEVSKKTDDSSKIDNHDEPAELPNFSNTPLQR